MDIVRLPIGEGAPIDADCLSIDNLAGGRVRLSGSALCGDESVALIGAEYAARDLAEAQGIAWADAQGVTLLYISTDAPSPGD